MARVRKALPPKVDVAHMISVGVLASISPRTPIDQVLDELAAQRCVSSRGKTGPRGAKR